MFEIAAICLVLTALLAYLNERFIGLPVALGVMAAALLLSLALIGLDAAGIDFGLRRYEEPLPRSIDFSTVLMQGMLSLLLFAGDRRLRARPSAACVGAACDSRPWPIGTDRVRWRAPLDPLSTPERRSPGEPTAKGGGVAIASQFWPGVVAS
jgi:hypothetical protein